MKAERRVALMSAFARNYDEGGCQKELQVGPHRMVSGVAKIQTHHLVERGAAAACHLPKTGNTRFRLQHATTVPALITCDLVSNGWPWANQRHLSPQHIPELRKLVQARSAEKIPEWRHARVVYDLEHRPLVGSIHPACLDIALDVLLMNPVIGVHAHGSELEHHERSAALSHALLPEKYGSPRCEFDKSGNKKEEWRERDQERQAADDIQDSLQGDLYNFLRLPVFSSAFEKNTRGSFAVWGVDLRVNRA